MTGIQSRDELVGDTSDDEPLSKTLKPGKKGSEDACKTASDIVEDASPKKPLKEPTSTADECPGHSSDDEPLSKLNESKGAKRSSKQQETASDSEDNQPLKLFIKKKMKQKAGSEETEDARKTRSPKKRKVATKASRIRVSSPSPSRSPAKVTQRRGRKGKDNSKKKASGHSPATNTTPKRRGRAKKEGKACSDSSDDEPLSEPARKKGEPARKKGELARKKGEPEMKQAVVLLERMSEQDVMDAVARGGTHTQEQKSAARADASSDDEPLVRKVKTAKVKDKFRKRANGEEDTVKQDKELSEEDERPH
ncbi:nucleolar protein dao-5-like isoform X5 [Silurus meridionalis]|uniref:nucleolar protein dao-5-like isoform X5 n=1 Tax=Silurus meridionalis TaxID=175797 RepID=UPI001EEA8AE6|nr:nucleolar protein dao-5-like isoform X5 [Silurus meridionalis]